MSSERQKIALPGPVVGIRVKSGARPTTRVELPVRPPFAAPPAPAPAPVLSPPPVRDAGAGGGGTATGRFRLVPNGAQPQPARDTGKHRIPTPPPTPPELLTLTRRLADALGEARGRAVDELRDVELRLAELALAVAERIVGCEIEAGRYGIAARIEEALSLARDRAEATVHLNPVDLAALGGGNASDGCRFVADPEVQRGDVVVETPGGRIVSAVQEQIEAVRRGLFLAEDAA